MWKLHLLLELANYLNYWVPLHKQLKHDKRFKLNLK